MKLININEMCKSFSEKYYDDNIDDILYDIINFNKKLFSENEVTEYDAVKAFRSICAYCNKKNIDMNKYIRLKIE